MPFPDRCNFEAGFKMWLKPLKPLSECLKPAGGLKRRVNRKNPNGIPSFSPGLARSAGLPRVIRQEFSSTPTRLASQSHKFKIREDAVVPGIAHCCESQTRGP